MFTKRVGYGKLGRVIELDQAKWGESGGDNEPPALLLTLARRHPTVEWVVVGKNSGWTPPLPNITNPWQEWRKELKTSTRATVIQRIALQDAVTGPTFDELDDVVLWLGQHGTSNSPVRKMSDRSIVTSPQISFVAYVSFLARGVSRWRALDPIKREEVWLLADARNYLKLRDLMWPRRHPILTQFNFERGEWCERYGDVRPPAEFGFTESEATSVGIDQWRVHDRYVGSGLELVGVPDEFCTIEPAGWEDRDQDFGVLINEARAYGIRPEMTRLHAMQHWIKPLDPSWIYGTWTAESLSKLELSIKPVPYAQIFGLMQRTKTTFTTPSSGSEWATAKPWESFASGVICFFHPKYDTQDHILFPDGRENATEEQRQLASWLRVKTPDELAKRVRAVSTSRETYEWLAAVQWMHLQREYERQRCVTMIEERLDL